jgi:hypothetical protein
MSPPGVGPESEVPARHPEPAPTTTAIVDNAKHNGHNGREPHALRLAIESLGRPLNECTILSAQVDPFRLDTEANHRDGEWLRNTMDRLNIGVIHVRGLHYALLTRPKPTGEPYTTADWEWLIRVTTVARWLGYVSYDRIIDQKNDAPVIRIWTPADPDPYIGVNYQVQVPDYDDLHPRVGLDGFTGAQPYRLAILGEKSSLDSVLGPIAKRYKADLFLPSGDVSNTMLHTLARVGAEDGRLLKVFYFSDCDPSGWHMPIVTAHKLRAFKVQLYPQLVFQCYRVALNPEQVRQYDLPISPVKETEKRGARWKEAMGVEQTEIDALATLQPRLLRRIAEQALDHFYDHTLDDRVEQVADEWTEAAQDAVDEQSGDDLARLREDAAARLAEKQDEIQQILDTVRMSTQGFTLPEIPDIPEAEIDTASQPEPLCDSRWSFAHQNDRLKASKNYDTNGHYDDGYVG